MPTQKVLGAKLHKRLDALRDVLKSLLDLTNKLSDKESSGIISDRLARLQSAALFVVVGEVKSGKSSFVNALLGEDVCEVAPDPCTAVIQELVYGEEENRTPMGNYAERVHLPKPVLREISIVDTPGTNSIIDKHETITANYIPQSDLVVFVFAATNPHTKTAWQLLDFIGKEWHRKTVFVLQQADLASQQQISTNQQAVKQYARQRNVQNPVVFTVSAKRERARESDSGFAEFRQFMLEAVESGEVWSMKVNGGRDTARGVVCSLLDALGKEEAKVAKAKAFYDGLVRKVEARRKKADSLQRLVVKSLTATYDRLCSALEQDVAGGLGVGSVLRRSIPLIRDKDMRTWLKDLQSQFESRAKHEIERESLQVSNDLSDEMQTMIDELVQSISDRQKDQGESSIPTISGPSEKDLARLKDKLNELRVSDIVKDEVIQGSGLGPLTLAGGGIVALGAIIALATHAIVLDITGGILATLGLALVALTLLWKRPAIISELHQKLARSSAEFRERLNQEITQILEKIFLEVDHRLKEPLTNLDKQAEEISRLMDEAVRIKTDIGRL